MKIQAKGSFDVALSRCMIQPEKKGGLHYALG